MVFEQPIPFDEAIKSNRIKTLLPTTLGSAELQQLDGDIHRRALMSAGVSDAGFLQRTKDLVDDILGEQRFSGIPQARVALREHLDKMDYQPARKGMSDLRTEGRLNLLLRTNIETSLGFGSYRQGLNPVILDVWPAQELFRAESRIVPRDWIERWTAAGGDFFGRRMIALKDDDVWQNLGDGVGGYNDTLGNPYPPFAFNSGMDVRDISRHEAIHLGLIDENQKVEPDDLDFNDGVGADMDGLDEDLQDTLVSVLGSGFEIVKGILQLSQI